MSDNDIKTERDDLFRDYSSAWDAAFSEMRQDLEMHLEAHFSQKQIDKAEAQGRTLYPFNKTARQVDLLHGYEIRNRHILKIGPVDKGDDFAANQHTAIIMQQMIAAAGYDILSEAFKWGVLVEGSNLLELYNDREGNRRFVRRPFSSFLLDPAMRNPDLSDCRNILTGQWIHEDNIKMLLPTYADEIDKIPAQTTGRWQDAPNWSRHEQIRLYEEQWGLRTDFIPHVLNRMTGEEEPFDEFKKKVSNSAKAANDLIKDLRAANGLPILTKYSKHRRQIIYRVFVDSELVHDGLNPTGLDEYNFVWLHGEWCPEMPRDELKVRSLTRRLRNPQYARDKRMNQLLDMFETSIMQGRVFREGALTNPDDAYKSGQGVAIEVSKEFAEIPLDHIIKELTGGNIGAGMFQAIDLLDKEETQVTGMSEEVLGSDDAKNMPGILHKYRTGQALTAQQPIFQRFRRAKKQLGVKMVKLNQIWLNPQKVQRMTNEQPQPGFYDPDFTRFDCTPTEGLLTDSQRELHFLQMQQLYTMFPNIIPASMVILSAPVQQPKELIEAIKRNEQQQAQMMQAQLQTKQAMDQMLLAQAGLDAAKAKGEIADAGYDRARTVTEMAKISDDSHLSRLELYLKWLELNQQAELARLQARQPEGATK
jgi:hypothetical protein